MKVRRESQSRLVHPSKLSVSSLGQIQVEDVDEVRPYDRFPKLAQESINDSMKIPSINVMMRPRNLQARETPENAVD